MANRNRHVLALVARTGLALGVFTAGCGGDDAAEDEGPPSAKPRRPDEKESAWSTGSVIAREAGLHVELVVTGEGRPAVAYYATEARDDGPCTEIMGDDQPERLLWDLYYAEERGTGFQTETIAEVLSFNVPQGLDLAVDMAGAPVVAALTGGPHVMLRFCSANDVGFYERTAANNWRVTTAVRSSGEAATGDEASDYGEVVGHWPGLAVDGSTGETAIAYKDVHAGGIQNDDLERADLEIALGRGGSWQALPIDWGAGAGSYNRALFDRDGRIVVLSYNPVESRTDDRHGLWVSRSADGGQTWEQTRLLRAPQLHAGSIALDPDGRLHVVYYDVTRGVPVLVSQRSTDGFLSLADDWQETTFGDTRYDEGYQPSLAFDASGALAVAYYRCANASAELGECAPADDALVFALRRPEGDSEYGDFEYEVVDSGESEGACGQDPSLAFEAGGHAIIAYQCQALEGGALVDELHFARREAL